MSKVKTKTKFVCTSCGAAFVKWQGRCAACEEWNTLIEEGEASIESFEGWSGAGNPQKLAEIVLAREERMLTGVGEFDRTLGGGLLKGSLVLIGGVPGIGKSTLVLQVSDKISAKYGKVLYVSGEESLQQIKLRADRLSVKSENLFLLSEVSLEAIIRKINQIKPSLVIVDSIQTLFDKNVESTPGSVSQVRQAVLELMKLAKTQGITVIIAGHVTKEGFIAGPKILEHMVDAVLYFEGEGVQQLRILRCVKNRFGATGEVGVFEMAANGLLEITDISKFLIGHRSQSPGSVITPVMEGTRCFLIEMQALTSKTNFGYPSRKCSGIDLNRLSLIIAVLEKKIGLCLSGSDIFVNVVNGVFVDETAVDLAAAAAIFSSFKGKTPEPVTAIFGEVGLLGEVRSVPFAANRVKELVKMGFKKCVLPKILITEDLKKHPIELIGVENLKEALALI